MITLHFIPENNNFAGAAQAYTTVWRREGNKITTAIEQATRLPFQENTIEAVIFEGHSISNPVLKLRASYDDDTKKATLVHELLHRLSAEYMLDLPVKADELSLGLHKQIDLRLYDIWATLYGKDFADTQVSIESSRGATYKNAWGWALSLTPEERHALFARLVPDKRK